MAGKRLLRVLAVVSLMLVAGCGGFGTGTPTNDGGVPGNGDGRSVQNVTEIAPGIGQEAGLVNRSALLWSHRRALNGSGFTYRFRNEQTTRTSFANENDRTGVDIAQTGRVAAESGLSTYLVNETDASTDTPTTVARYVGPNAGAERTVRAGNETVTDYDEEATVLLTTHYLVSNLLADGSWTVVERRDDAIVLETGPAWSDWGTEMAGDTNVTTRTFVDGELVVSRDGTMERLTFNRTSVERLRRDGEFHSKSATTRLFEYELLETNGTRVDRPSWVPTAENGTAVEPAGGNESTAAGNLGRP